MYGSVMVGVEDGFRVRYLGCTSFNNRKRQIGISVLQRPLLELYSAARRRGEDQRSAHPLALTQDLNISDYGLVVADSEIDQNTGNTVPVVTKVITPLPNIVLWAAVRFNSRIVKRKTFGAAFIPIACSDAIVDPKSYVQLGSKQRFLVSLTHPSIFVCLLRSVATPKLLECHAFVCATAEDAITLCAHLGTARDDGSSLGSSQERMKNRKNVENTIPWADETPSDITVPSEIAPVATKSNYLTVPSYHNEKLENRNKSKQQNGNHNNHYYSEKKVPSITTSKYQKNSNEYHTRRNPPTKFHPTQNNVITLQVSSPKFSKHTNPPSSRTGSEVGSYLSRIDERWEPYWNPYRKDYRANGFPKTPSTSGCSALSERRIGGIRKRMKDMATMTDDYLWTTDASSWLASDGPESWISSPNHSDSTLVKSQNSQRILEEMTLTETMEFSSESEESEVPWNKTHWNNESNTGTKLTYFGYECYRPPTSRESDNDSRHHRGTSKSKKYQKSSRNNTNNKDNSITINGNYPSEYRSTPDSSIYLVPNPRTACHMPQGIRSYNKSGQVKNWSNLSQVSDSSYRRSETLPLPRSSKQSSSKMIRWSSDEQVNRKYSFLATIKRISQSSLQKAKQKTGKLIKNFRNHGKRNKKGKKSTDYSEDSAYETSEVCLSPRGQSQIKKRNMSWSFHDLRLISPNSKTNSEKVHYRPSSPAGSALGGSTAKQLVIKKKRRKRRRKHDPLRGHSSSDSGVDEYHSDYSETLKNRQKSEYEMKQFANQVTRVHVKHGTSRENFHRWSQTDLREELGYIP